jgi:hypothetical protein
MAETIKDYGHLGMHLQAGDLSWVADTIKCALTTSAYAVSQANDEFFSSVTNEIAAGGGYAAGGFTLAGKSVSYDAATRQTRFLADDINLAALTPASPFRYGVVYKSTGVAGTSFLIAYINFATDRDPAGGVFGVQWAPTGVSFIQAT